MRIKFEIADDNSVTVIEDDSDGFVHKVETSGTSKVVTLKIKTPPPPEPTEMTFGDDV